MEVWQRQGRNSASSSLRRAARVKLHQGHARQLHQQTMSMMLQQQAQVQAPKKVKHPPLHPSLKRKRKRKQSKAGHAPTTNSNKDTFQMERIGHMKSFPIKSWVVVHAVLFSTAVLLAGNQLSKGNHLQPWGLNSRLNWLQQHLLGMLMMMDHGRVGAGVMKRRSGFRKQRRKCQMCQQSFAS